MRLLNTTTFELSEYFGVDIPSYAILSHRWAGSEVTFQDLQSGKGPGHTGWQKILGCCKQAEKDGYEFVWIDSCCIDKSSSAELSEAINSMFQWYQNSGVCYAYLSDVNVVHNDPKDCNDPEDYSDPEDWFDWQFRRSKWFTRGWTLQELLAPQRVVFFNCDWIQLGDKSNLEDIISSITGIKHLFQYQSACIAQKMSWASERVTLRSEDMAYCLMGLFGVNMPLLYGEGDKAFLRLQIEIMRVSDDESLFAWVEDQFQFNDRVKRGLLAQSPRAFKRSGDVELLPNIRKTPYTMTNKGLQIELELRPAPEWIQDLMSGHYPRPATKLSTLSGVVSFMRNKDNSDCSTTKPTFVAALCCAKKDSVKPIAIALVKVSPHLEEYSRIACDRLLAKAGVGAGQGNYVPRAIFVRQGEGSVLHRGSTTILLNLTNTNSLLKCYEIGPANFHPGLLISGEFKPSQAKSVMNPEEFRLESFTGLVTRVSLTLGYGITVFEIIREDRKHSFLVELGISQDKLPTIDILPSKDLNDTRKKAKDECPAKISTTRKDGSEGIHKELVPGIYTFIRVFIGNRAGSRHYGLLVQIYDKSADSDGVARLFEEYTAEYM